MKPLEVGPAITRLLMLTAGEDLAADAIEEALTAFDTPEDVRRLAAALAVHAAHRVPDGATLAITDNADFVAFAILGHGDHPGGCAAAMVEALPEGLLYPVTMSLLGFWHQASLQAAAAEPELHVPDFLPEDA